MNPRPEERQYWPVNAKKGGNHRSTLHRGNLRSTPRRSICLPFLYNDDYLPLFDTY